MITLYVKIGCPFCRKVLDVVEELKIAPTLRNIADPGVIEDLVRIGGQQRTPFMIDDEKDTMLYGSDEIVAYLHQRFGKDA